MIKQYKLHFTDEISENWPKQSNISMNASIYFPFHRHASQQNSPKDCSQKHPLKCMLLLHYPGQPSFHHHHCYVYLLYLIILCMYNYAIYRSVKICRMQLMLLMGCGETEPAKIDTELAKKLIADFGIIYLHIWEIKITHIRLREKICPWHLKLVLRIWETYRKPVSKIFKILKNILSKW